MGCPGAPELGADAVAPLVRPCEAGIRYVVAETEAVICGKPWGAGAKLNALRVINRPLTDSVLSVATTNRCSRSKKLARWKKLPWNVNVKGSTGKPAGPSAAPGGSVAIAEDDTAALAAAAPEALG